MFGTIKALKLKLMEEMDTSTLDFQLGYFSGKQSKKRWLIEEGDLKEMYAKDSKNSIILWCDRAEEQSEIKHKRSSSHDYSKSKKIEIDDLEETAQDKGGTW